MFQKTEDAICVRTQATGDKIYLVQEGKKWWIRNPETLTALGFKFGDEKMIETSEFLKYENAGFVDFKEATIRAEEQKDYQKVPGKVKPPLNYRKTA